jgi:UDP-2,4-diacetamido-2,4,6-trideoxy-beta-L-altropyranose hydrolase
MRVTIRADGGPEIGYGHLIRSSALAEELLTRGHTVSYATTTSEHTDEVCPDAAEIMQLPSRTDVEPFVEWLDSTDVDFVFTDAYPVDTEYQRTVQDYTPLAVLQDDAQHAVCANLFVNGNLYAANFDYEFVGQEPTKCLGPKYVLLRNEIRNRSTDDPPWRNHPERAIVTMGGSDIADMTSTVVQAFEGFEITVDAIVGPGFSDGQEVDIRSAADDVSADVRVIRNPDDLVNRMFQADFAVSTASSTTYELLGLGTPIVSIPVADNQEPIAAALQDRDLATVLRREAKSDEIREAIRAYVNRPELRRNRRERGRNLVDGRGAERIAGLMTDIAEVQSDI